MARLLIAADLLLDTAVGGIADLSAEVAATARQAPFDALANLVNYAVSARAGLVVFAGASHAASPLGRAHLVAATERLRQAGIGLLGPAATQSEPALSTVGDCTVELVAHLAGDRGEVVVSCGGAELARLQVGNATRFNGGRGTLSALQPRVRLQREDEAGALLLDVAPGRVSEVVVACHRLEPVVVPVTLDHGTADFEGLARALCDEASACAAARPGRLIVAQALVAPGPELREQLAAPGGTNRAAQAARSVWDAHARANPGTYPHGPALWWWERVECAPHRPGDEAAADGSLDASTDIARLLTLTARQLGELPNVAAAGDGPSMAAAGPTSVSTARQQLAAWLGAAVTADARAIASLCAIDPLDATADALESARNLALDLVGAPAGERPTEVRPAAEAPTVGQPTTGQLTAERPVRG